MLHSSTLESSHYPPVAGRPQGSEILPNSSTAASILVVDDVVDIVKGFELGGVDYITKPVRTGELLVRIENQIKLRSLQNQLAEQNQPLKQALPQQNTAAAALRESEEKFSTAFRNSPLPITITSVPEGNFLEVNRAYTEQSGYTAAELIGQSIQTLDVANVAI